MKKTLNFLLLVALTAVLCLCLASCNKAPEADDIWSNAAYTKDTELGNGAKTVAVEVKAVGKSVTFTIKTDKATLGDALMEPNLISGDQSTYGLYVKVVNGITADYDKDKTYWALTKDGESTATGVDYTEIADGEHYELVYTK